MRLWPRSLKWRTILLTLLGLVAVGGTAGYVWWRPIRGYVSNQMEIWKDRDSEHPVTRGLARGEIRAGSSVEELIATHPPKRVARHGRFVDVTYADGPCLTAMDGKLVLAYLGWCSQSTVYFNHLSPAEEREWSDSSSAELDRRIEEWKNLHGAVGGLMGCVEFDRRLKKLANPDPYPEDLWETESADPHRSVGGVAAFMPHCPRFHDVVAGPAEER
jgi:hypothetical protein